jgi:hypothetical protein
VETNGQTLIVAISAPTGRTLPVLYSDVSLSSAVTFPNTITSNTTYYAANVPTDVIVSVKQSDGTELHGLAVKLEPGTPKTIAPLPSAAQVGADVQRRGQFLPTGARAATFGRAGVQQANAGTLTSGTMLLCSIDLPAGLVVTSATFLSGTTALSGGTNQWFALYSSARALLGQTADDTSTAWGTNATKTLTFASPITTTYTGQHYLGIMVAASTVPTLFANTINTALSQITPVVVGASTTGLTDTAPATAAALSASGLLPFAYVS